MTEQPVEWRLDAANSVSIRTVMYAWLGLLGGGILLVVGLLAFVAASAAVAGSYGVFALVTLLFLVGGPFSLLYLWPAVRSGSFSPLSQFVLDVASDPEEPLAERYAEAFSWRGVIASIGVHAVGIPALLFVEPRLLGGYVAVSFVELVVVSGFVTWGRIDTAEPSFEYRSTTIPLSAVKRIRRYRLGDVVVCWLSYDSGEKTITTPSWVVLTPEAASAFDTARAVAAETPSDSDPSRNGPKVVAVGLGLGFVTFAGWLWLFADLDPGMARYVLVVFGGLGLFFVWVGLVYA
ncbi:hypothetical protein [Halobacterium bonnevillei]|uniref:PH domain-containing protein n=1 Tax=Halobacterium bonnevillei TaxID=2692200 RepID=A0A6B0SHM2_9EURY|nr:hypothetical protein [Halobacterium bonnevillei]MXR20046.1 hypothetical protein [Halobacterium bonnevillei]